MAILSSEHRPPCDRFQAGDRTARLRGAGAGLAARPARPVSCPASCCCCDCRGPWADWHRRGPLLPAAFVSWSAMPNTDRRRRPDVGPSQPRFTPAHPVSASFPSPLVQSQGRVTSIACAVPGLIRPVSEPSLLIIHRPCVVASALSSPLCELHNMVYSRF